jgi:hypothetical protein
MLVLVCARVCSTKLEIARRMACMSDKKGMSDNRSTYNRNCTVIHKNAVHRSQTAERPPLQKKVPHIQYSHLSSLDNLMMAYIQGRNV